MRRPRRISPQCFALICLCVAISSAEAAFWKTPFFRRSLADRTAPATISAGTDCAARGFLVSLWHAPSGSDAAAALRSSVGGAPDSQFVTQNLTFGLDSVTGGPALFLDEASSQIYTLLAQQKPSPTKERLLCKDAGTVCLHLPARVWVSLCVCGGGGRL